MLKQMRKSKKKNFMIMITLPRIKTQTQMRIAERQNLKR